MKVSEPVSCILGTGKKYRYRYRQNLVPEKSIGIGIEDIWYRKKVSVSVSLKIMGTVTLWPLHDEVKSVLGIKESYSMEKKA